MMTQREYNRNRDLEAKKYEKYYPKRHKYRDFVDYLEKDKKRERLMDIIWTSIIVLTIFGFFGLLLFLN